MPSTSRKAWERLTIRAIGRLNRDAATGADGTSHGVHLLGSNVSKRHMPLLDDTILSTTIPAGPGPVNALPRPPIRVTISKTNATAMPSASRPKRTVFITGGIVSGIGKGITAASIGRLLLDRGFSVAAVKADPYLNQDAGTMNPFRHGEVFVTDDGAETDLDLGHYERFLDKSLDKNSCFTGGSIYRAVMEHERDGDFLGRDIQVIPHITDEIKSRLRIAQDDSDFLLAEVGGTVGDIEATAIIEAVRQYKLENPKDTIFVHVVKMDYLYPSDEGKTKPIQHSIITLRSYGIQADILIVRCKRDLTMEEREKLALFTGVPASRIIPAMNADSLYDIPENLEKEGLADAILDGFGLKPVKSKPLWKDLPAKMAARKGSLKIGLVGKYTDLDDAYLSVMESIRHAGIFHGVATEVVPINSESPSVKKEVSSVDAIIVPGGFGNRGVEGKILAVKTAREKGIPFLGICLGLQVAVIEYARSKAKMKDATSGEFDESAVEPMIAILPDQRGIKKKGGTMRLGSYPAVLAPGSLAEKVYKDYRPDEIKNHTVNERHRHRYEVNPLYHEALTKAGLVISGTSPEGELAEFIELPKSVHPYFIATQAHPEFKSRPHRPHPLFAGLIKAAKKK